MHGRVQERSWLWLGGSVTRLLVVLALACGMLRGQSAPGARFEVTETTIAETQAAAGGGTGDLHGDRHRLPGADRDV